VQKKVGILPKDTSSGPFIDEWKKVYGDISKDVEEVDISTALSSAALAVKDENELVAPTDNLGREMLISVAASYAECLESLYRPHEPILRRRDVECVG
jgi:nucleosome binding factor SPN SPT16 subunit